MEFKGTKGKWKLIGGWDKNGKGCFPSVIFFGTEMDHRNRYGRNGITINSSHDQKIESLMANALLISKAPEMLEMLEKIVNQLSFIESLNFESDIELLEKAKILIKESTEL